MLQNLPRHFDDPEFREDALRGIGKTIERINSLVRKLGAFRQKLEICPVQADFNGLVREVLHELNGAMEGVEVITEFHPVPAAEFDPAQIQSVVTNLLMNAREALGTDGRIRVSTRASKGRAVLTVEDNGCGMSAEYVKESLFRPFQSTKSKGLGIGIFQARLIVEAHSGKMDVESTPDRGTTFHVTLPLQTK